MVVPPGLVTMSFRSTRVLARVEEELRRAVDRLRGVSSSATFAGQADLHAAVGECLDEQHDVCRPASGKAGDGVQMPLVEYDGFSDGVEQCSRHVQICR